MGKIEIVLKKSVLPFLFLVVVLVWYAVFYNWQRGKSENINFHFNRANQLYEII